MNSLERILISARDSLGSGVSIVEGYTDLTLITDWKGAGTVDALFQKVQFTHPEARLGVSDVLGIWSGIMESHRWNLVGCWMQALSQSGMPSLLSFMSEVDPKPNWEYQFLCRYTDNFGYHALYGKEK